MSQVESLFLHWPFKYPSIRHKSLHVTATVGIDVVDVVVFLMDVVIGRVVIQIVVVVTFVFSSSSVKFLISVVSCIVIIVPEIWELLSSIGYILCLNQRPVES